VLLDQQASAVNPSRWHRRLKASVEKARKVREAEAGFEMKGKGLRPPAEAGGNTYLGSEWSMLRACGRGQSLVVWAISEGRECARGVDTDLMGRTFLPTKGEGDLPRV